jgi:hypothetical protein
MTQVPLTPRLSHAIRALFAPQKAEMAAKRLLDECSSERLAVSDGGQLERIRAAALKRSGGSLSALDDALRLAGRDWRDLSWRLDSARSSTLTKSG